MIGSTHVIMLVAGAVIVVGSVCFWLAPSWLRWWRRWRWAQHRVRVEDALKHTHDCGLRGEQAARESLARVLRQSLAQTDKLVAQLESRGLIRASAAGLILTAEGEQLALQVIRAHRLWERYLVDEARMPLVRVHAEAERREHGRSADQLDALEAAMGHPTVDPHGAPIPTGSGDLADSKVRTVLDWQVGTPARIVHLEDEPPAVFARIASLGLRPGHVVRVLASDADRLVLELGGKTVRLAPAAGANILVGPVGQGPQPAARRRLPVLRQGQRAKVVGLAEPLRGFTRRRLLDLGITPGVVIEAEMSGVFNDPVAYRVRGSLVALRREQAEHVLISSDAVDRQGSVTDG
ncbi:MAG: FeoA domain-containing protein [Phycisphaerae bacterium]